MTRTDSLGQTYSLTGLQAYVSVNRNLNTVGAAALGFAPAFSPPSGLLTAAATATVTGDVLTVAYTATPLATGCKLVVWATRPLSAGINFQQKGAYKIIKVSAAAAASPMDLFDEYTAIYGFLLAGQKILFKAQVIDTVTGLASTPPLEFSTIIESV